MSETAQKIRVVAESLEKLVAKSQGTQQEFLGLTPFFCGRPSP